LAPNVLTEVGFASIAVWASKYLIGLNNLYFRGLQMNRDDPKGAIKKLSLDSAHHTHACGQCKLLFYNNNKSAEGERY
jgi:hypothetical protein